MIVRRRRRFLNALNINSSFLQKYTKTTHVAVSTFRLFHWINWVKQVAQARRTIAVLASSADLTTRKDL